MSIKAIVLAAGAGTRMKSPYPKVVASVAGRALVNWVLDALSGVDVTETVVVVGSGADRVQAILPPGIRSALQERQLGTGHAVQVGLASLTPSSGDHIMVLPGDTPLLTSETLANLLDAHRRTGSAATCLTAKVPDPTGYGRILRDGWDHVTGIVEHKDATPAQLEVDEINGGVYVFDAELLAEALTEVRADNAQGELYLTDVLAILGVAGHSISAHCTNAAELAGVNSQDQLADAAKLIRQRMNTEAMQAGVWMQDPTSVYLDADVTIEAGARIQANVHLVDGTSVGAGAEVGPDVFAAGSNIGPNAKVWYSVLRGAEVGEAVEVGPFASLRPGAVLESGAKAGTFVELKNTTVGPGAKVPHLAYIGDTDIGAKANVGAGTITCNYDGYDKFRTVIGEGAFVGSNTMLVAPVEIGKNAVTGAGSVIVDDVEEDALGIGRSRQENVAGYAARRRQTAENPLSDQSTS